MASRGPPSSRPTHDYQDSTAKIPRMMANITSVLGSRPFYHRYSGILGTHASASNAGVVGGARPDGRRARSARLQAAPGSRKYPGRVCGVRKGGSNGEGYLRHLEHPGEPQL